MNTVKRFVCYYAGINLVLAALLLGIAWVAPEDDGGAAPVAQSHAMATPAAMTSAAMTSAAMASTALTIATPVSAPAPLLASAELPAN